MSAERRTRPAVKEIKDAYEYLFNSSINLSKIKDTALGGRLFSAANNEEDESAGVTGRSLAWKLFLLPNEPLTSATTDAVAAPPFDSLRTARKDFKHLLLERMRAPDGSYEEGLIIPGTTESPPRLERTNGNLDRNNPLSLHDENPWTEWFSSMELRKTILQDVERTFPDIGYFRDNEVQTQLTNILFVYSVTHPDIGYRQGMHELLAPLYYAVDYDSLSPSQSSSALPLDSPVREFCSRLWVAADAWALFDAVMRGAGRWYEWRESKEPEKAALSSHVQLNVANDHSIKPYVSPIVRACNRIQGTFLKAVDPELWRKMQSAGIEPQIYGIRWLRLLFTREFTMSNAMILWDGLFACDPALDLAQWVCVAMLMRIRNQLIPSDYSSQLTYLLRYPPQTTSSTAHPSSLLIRQALTFQMSPTAATGISIIHENKNLLDIPVEVPESSPPPVRRRPKLAERRASDSRSPPGDSNANRFHTRQGSASMGLPEMLARGLLERGESLGINKTVMNAVSELKRNLPDLANSLARLPHTPSTSYAAYPLVDERSPSERPPWEPRTRFEMEKDISDMRNLQRRLGDSVTWIVDTLLLDESDGDDEEKAKSIKLRKREALESLSYVRDLLKGTVNPSELEEERLMSEEQLKVNKARISEEKQRAAESPPPGNSKQHIPVQDRLRGAPMPPQPAAAASPPKAESRARSTVTRASGDYFPAMSSGPSTFSTKPPIHIPGHLSSTTTPAASPSILTANADSTPLAPWNYTRSSFLSSESPLAPLPRLPPKSSTALHNGAGRTPMHMGVPSLQSPPGGNVSRDQAPRKQGVQHDPLGAIP